MNLSKLFNVERSMLAERKGYTATAAAARKI